MKRQLSRAGERIGCIFWLIAVVTAWAAQGQPEPVVPGYSILRGSGKVDAALQAELLLGELNCVSCHAAAAGSRISAKGAPDLSAVGARATPQYFRALLSNPHAAKPGTTMPDLFHASAPEPKKGAVEFLVHFLVSQGGPIADPIGAGTPAIVESGRALYHSVGCIACHAPEKESEKLKSPVVPLGNLAQKTTQAALTEFLLNPYHARPSGRMPSMALNIVEARAIATYLLRDQFGVAGATTRPLAGTGVRYECFEDDFITAKPDSFAAGLTAKSTGKIKTFTVDIPGRKEKNHFGIRFGGSIWIPRDGTYTFGLKSDDGSFLLIDHKVIVAHDGSHPVDKEMLSEPIELKAGMHPIGVTYFQNGGGLGLEVFWEGPDIAHQPIPTDVLAIDPGKAMAPLDGESFVVEPQKAMMGGQMFSMLGCASCHALPNRPSLKKAKPLAELKVDNPQGCLGEQIVKGVPKYDLSADQRAAIAETLKNVASLNAPMTPAAKAMHEMAAVGCLACHQRDNIGGIPADRNELFKSMPNVDLGDEGRIPPRLTGVGAKLLPDALARIIFGGELRVRPYLLARMPVFKQDKLADLPEAIVTADLAAEPAGSPALQPASEKDGRKLVGVRGLGCVNCHGVRGAKSLGVPSPDLATARDRLRPQWFRRLLANPNDVNPGTRMPAFWNEGESGIKEILGGAFEPQASAIWSYAQQGKEMTLPPGLRLDDNDEIVPTDEVVVLRAFVTDVGPRAILVGNPESVHWVFDANTVRLAKAWHGKFFDAAGIWEKRGGTARAPLGKDVVNLPAGPSFAILDSQGAPWPDSTGLFDRNAGGRFRGYTLDKQGRPTFRYTLRNVEVQEKDVPKGAGDGAELERRFTLAASAPMGNLYFLIASGKKIEPKGAAAWLVDDKIVVRLIMGNGGGAASTQIREGKDGNKQLVMPVAFTQGGAEFSVEMGW